ncbi:MAG TPA: HEAT repeat domain-containing protein [Myxococcales bacterium]|nr:HEAT repeat domain-containing protein [Myxococcales bacterium]
MGLLDLLGIGGTKEERETRSVRKLQKKAVEKYGPKENRQGAIEELGEMRTPRAVEALLMRYTVRVEPGITDDEEKQRVLALVQQAGSGIAVPVLKSFILRRDEVSWPLKALSDLLPEAEVVAFLVEALRKAAGEYSRVPEKKVLLLHALAQHQSRDAVPAALPFLDDMDDEVQIAAAQAMAVQKDERAREPLIQHFLRAHQASNARVREALASLLADTHFDVKGYTPKMEASLPASYKLDSKGRVVRKS